MLREVITGVRRANGLIRSAASRINFSARAILASRSQLHAICVAATVTMLMKYYAT